MKKILSIIIIQIIGQTICCAQFPHIIGTVKLSVQKGIIECDLEISNIPKISGYSILLNTGLNIKYFRNSDDTFNYFYDRYYCNEQSYEAFQYYFPNNDNTKRFLPKSFKISYVGAFPVITDTLKASNGSDWKGNIAFNGEYVRASEQSVWYPILYDTLNNVMYDKVTYDLNVMCEDGKSIYINGSSPVNGSLASLSSNTPFSLLLFVGNYEFIKKDNTWFVNTTLNESQQAVLSAWSDKIINFYESKLQIPYGPPVTFLGASPISKNQSWMFVTYPTIAVIGRYPYNIKGYFDEKTQHLKDSSSIKYFSHELGHFYFGVYFIPNSELRWMFLEGVTEYLALQVICEILGESFYKESIANYVKQIKESKLPSIKNIKQENEIDESYRYNYIPLLLTVLEKQIGMEKMWKWINIVLTSKDAKTNYDFFKSTLIQSGVTHKEFIDFENTYIKSKDAKKNVINNAF